MKKCFSCLLFFALLCALPAHAAYSDVPEWEWYQPYVTELSAQGVISGYEDGTFRPDRPLTRTEASVILIAYCTKTENPILSGRLPELEEPKDEKEIPGWAADAVHKSLRAGLFRGYPDGTFGPSRTITRAEIAAVLCNRLRENYPQVFIAKPV